MKIRIEDLNGFGTTIELHNPTTVKSIKDMIINQSQYKPKNCILFHKQNQLQNENIIWNSDFEENSLFVLFSPLDLLIHNFPGNSSRYHFPTSKYLFVL